MTKVTCEIMHRSVKVIKRQATMLVVIGAYRKNHEYDWLASLAEQARDKLHSNGMLEQFLK